MKKMLLTIAFALATSTAVYAQAGDNSGPPPADLVHDVMGHVNSTNAPRTQLPAGTAAQVGTVLPEGVALQQFPAGHRAHQHAFVRVGDTVLLVEPGTRRVIHVLR